MGEQAIRAVQQRGEGPAGERPRLCSRAVKATPEERIVPRLGRSRSGGVAQGCAHQAEVASRYRGTVPPVVACVRPPSCRPRGGAPRWPRPCAPIAGAPGRLSAAQVDRAAGIGRARGRGLWKAAAKSHRIDGCVAGKSAAQRARQGPRAAPCRSARLVGCAGAPGEWARRASQRAGGASLRGTPRSGFLVAERSRSRKHG